MSLKEIVDEVLGIGSVRKVREETEAPSGSKWKDLWEVLCKKGIFLSPSSILAYEVCPRRYRYMESGCVAVPPPEHMLFGRLVHEAIRIYYEKLPTSVTPREVPFLIKEAASSVGLSFTDRLVRILEGFSEFEQHRLGWHYSPKPVAIEKKFESPPFRGIVDAVFRKGDGTLVVDWKTGYMRGGVLDDGMTLQGMIYRYLTGAEKVIFIFLQSSRWVELPNLGMEWLFNRVQRVAEGILSERFEMVEGRHCDSCPYSTTCYFEKHGIKLWGV